VLASLQDSPKFRMLWISNLFFFGGAWTQTLVLGWIVFETTGSEFLLALFTAVRLLPLLLGPFGGVLSDRFDRVRLLIVACAWALCAVSVVATLASLGHAPYWALLLGGLAIGLAQSPSQPARAAFVLDLVGRDNLSNANALNAMAINMTQVVGPALGGAMISSFGAPAALWISTGWYGLSLLALLPLRAQKTSRHPHQESAWQMLAGGFRAVLASRLVSSVLLVTLAANILIWPVYQSFMPVFAVDVLHLDAAGLGWLLTCYGAGGLAGSMIVAGLGDFRFKGGLFVIGTAIWGLLWAIFALSHSVPLAFSIMVLVGLMSAPFIILQTTLLLMTNPPEMQGRALGMQELVIGIMPLSALAVGAVAQQVGVGATTVGCGLLLATAMLVLATRVPDLVRFSGIEHP
jgi:MFS family permease